MQCHATSGSGLGPGPPSMVEIPWVSSKVGGVSRVAGERVSGPGMGYNLGQRWKGIPFFRGELGTAGTIPPPTPPVSGRRPPGRRRKPGSCIDRPWTLLIIWKSRRLGVLAGRRGGASARRPRLAPPRPAQQLRPGLRGSRFTRWLRTWPGPGLGVRPPPPAPNWLICRCVNRAAAPPPV